MSGTYLDYEALSLCPAPAGWRALYILGPDEDGQGFLSEPLVALAVYEVTSRPVKGSLAPERPQGREIHGVVDCGGYFGAPEETANFWEYRGPDQPDPTADEVAAERAQQRQIAAIRARHKVSP